VGVFKANHFIKKMIRTTKPRFDDQDEKKKAPSLNPLKTVQEPQRGVDHYDKRRKCWVFYDD
tara:strand:- start:267 stop:452 length:186 start_codon:yes stop_codon:yes gene_type:complete